LLPGRRRGIGLPLDGMARLGITYAGSIRRMCWSWPVIEVIQSFGGHESTMSSSQKQYPAEFTSQMVELVRAGRTPNELSR